jgi:ubiquinone/menaquinone biosynthesis C-methylase UbiE
MASTVKAYKGMGMEGSTARWYDRTTRKDMPEIKALALRIAAEAPAGAHVLEVAPGPGFLSIELAKRRLQVRAVDISKTFVEIARQRAEETGVRVDFQRGNASDLPLGKNSVDFVVCRAAFKNFSEPVKAIEEMHRVLRPGGRALIIDLRRDVSQGDVNAHVDRFGLGMVSRWMTKLTFRFMLIKRAYTSAEFHQMVSETSFGRCELRPDDIGFEVWLQKPAG